MGRHALSLSASSVSLVFLLGACGAIISVDRVESAKTPFSNLDDVQKAMVQNAVNDGIYFRINAKYDGTGSKYNLLNECLNADRLKLHTTKRAAVFLAGLKATNQESAQRVPVFGYVCDDTQGPTHSGVSAERVDFVPPILLQNFYDDVQVSLAYRYLERTNIPFKEIGSLISGVAQMYGGLPPVLTTATINRVASNLEREISERFTSVGDYNFSIEYQIGPGRKNLTEFKVLLFYQDAPEPPQPAGAVEFKLVPITTLSNATPDVTTGAPRFRAYTFDRFPNVPHPTNSEVRLKAKFAESVTKLKELFPKVEVAHRPFFVNGWCDDLAKVVREFNLNHYDAGYVLWSALETALPDLFNKRPDYIGFNCLEPYKVAIKTAGLDLKDREGLIAEAKEFAAKAEHAADRTKMAATLVQGAVKSGIAVSGAYTTAATAFDAAMRAKSAAELGIVPAARAAAETAANAQENVLTQIKNNPNKKIHQLATDRRIQPSGG